MNVVKSGINFCTAIHPCKTSLLTPCRLRYILGDMKQYTSAEMAQLTGKAARTVRKAAEAGGIGQKVGRDWVFTDADIAKIKRVVGAPRVRPRKVGAVAVVEGEQAP